MIIHQITPHIKAISTPYKDIFTTLCLIETEEGYALFDAASYPEDAERYVFPFLEACQVEEKDLKYVFISHNHTDHAEGLPGLLTRFPHVKVLSRSETLSSEVPQAEVIFPEEGDVFLGTLEVIAIPGHTKDSAALLDRRSGMLLTGDCLQLYGIYGSGAWGANINFPVDFLEALSRLEQREDVKAIYTAHDYHPYGQWHVGEERIRQVYEASRAPLMKLRDLVLAYPEETEKEICARYQAAEYLPRMGAHVVRAIKARLPEIK